MILMTIRMKVLPEKRKELYQAITSLVGSIRTQNGSRRCDFCVSAEDENEFCLFGEWESEKDLASHLESNVFKVLLGAMSLLQNPHELKLYTDLSAQQALNPAEELNQALRRKEVVRPV
jgi:quinol monooxygenase YgiN